MARFDQGRRHNVNYHIGKQSGGYIENIGGNKYHYGDDATAQRHELQRSGWGVKLTLALAMLLCVGGMGIFGYTVLTYDPSFDDPNFGQMPEGIVLGAAVFFAGFILAGLAKAMLFFRREDPVSARPAGNVTFNIGSQNGAITNIAGDQVIHGGQHIAIGAAFAGIPANIDAIERALGDVAMRPADLDATRAAIDEARRESADPRAEPGRVAGAIERLTDILVRTGALASAGAALAGPLGAIAAALGPLGAAIGRKLART